MGHPLFCNLQHITHAHLGLIQMLKMFDFFTIKWKYQEKMLQWQVNADAVCNSKMGRLFFYVFFDIIFLGGGDA